MTIILKYLFPIFEFYIFALIAHWFFKEKYIYEDSKLISLTDGGLILDKGDMIDLVLKDVKYSKGFFNCIATILDKDKDLAAVNPIKKI